MSRTVLFARGDTLKALQVTLKDQDGIPLNLTGGAVRIQGSWADINITLDIAGTLVTPTSGICKFVAIGNAVSVGQMGARRQVICNAQVKFTDSGGLIGYSGVIPLRIEVPPL